MPRLSFMRDVCFSLRRRNCRVFLFSLECDALSRSIINDRRAHQNTAKLATGWFVLLLVVSAGDKLCSKR